MIVSLMVMAIYQTLKNILDYFLVIAEWQRNIENFSPCEWSWSLWSCPAWSESAKKEIDLIRTIGTITLTSVVMSVMTASLLTMFMFAVMLMFTIVSVSIFVLVFSIMSVSISCLVTFLVIWFWEMRKSRDMIPANIRSLTSSLLGRALTQTTASTTKQSTIVNFMISFYSYFFFTEKMILNCWMLEIQFATVLALDWLSYFILYLHITFSL